MSIKPPEIASAIERRLVMFCSENRLDRELYWSGFGFQIWCQLLTHISRRKDADILVIDEPEVYLHPDLQRQLLGILRDIAPDIILATHSTEILGEADPCEIILVDKQKASAERLKDISGIQRALDSLGSIQNVTLAQLARTRKILFVEGMDDYRIIRRFAKLVGLSELASGSNLTPLESGGFSSWEKVQALSWGLRNTLGANLRIGAIYDHDYWSEEQISETKKSLSDQVYLAHIHGRKEIENYLLVPSVLSRAVQQAISDREKRKGVQLNRDESIEDLLDTISRKKKSVIQGQYIGKFCAHFKSSGKDQGSLSAEAIERFENKWESLDTRMEIVPGKDILRELRTYASEKWSITLTDIRIIDEFSAQEIPTDLRELLFMLDKFRIDANNN
jgi:predicted ATP-dependent endonuclease of OLD family